jgi:hypothetical protein
VAEPGSAAIGLLLGGVLAVLVLANAEGAAEPIAMRISLAVQYCAPGILALLAGVRRRPGLYLAAGVVGMATPFTSMSVLGIPFYVPAGMSLVAYGRRAGDSRGKVADPLIAMAASAFLVASLVALFVHQDPYCRTGPTFSDCSSNIITRAEATLSLAFALATILIPLVLAAPSRKRRLEIP